MANLTRFPWSDQIKKKS